MARIDLRDFKTKQIANMTQTSLLGGASYLIGAALLCLLLAIFHSRHEPAFYEVGTEATRAVDRQRRMVM